MHRARFLITRAPRIAAVTTVMAMVLASCGDDSGEGPESEEESSTGDQTTWYQDVQPIIAEHCWACHNADNELAFSLQSYEEARVMSPFMLPKIEGSDAPPFVMPPFGMRETDECTPETPWRDDPRLSQEKIDTIAAWIADGTPEGNADDPADVPDWQVEGLSGQLQTLESSGLAIDDGEIDDQYRCFSLDPQLSSDSWLTGVQINPGNHDVVHHVVLFADPAAESANLGGVDGSYDCFGSSGVENGPVLFAWAPGTQPLEIPANAGLEVAAGSRIVMQVHYHPTGEAAFDQSSVSLRWADEQPERTAAMLLVGGVSVLQTNSPEWTDPPFEIPAGATEHVEEWRESVPVPPLVDIRVWTVMPHMHLAGKKIRVSLEHDDIDDECLGEVPQWDFEWQRAYVYDGEFEDFPRAFPDDVVSVRCTYDNSMDNPFIADALEEQGLGEPQPIGVGEETLDEMCLGIVGIVY